MGEGCDMGVMMMGGVTVFPPFFVEGWAIPKKNLQRKSLIGKGEFGGKMISLYLSKVHGQL